MPSLQDAINAAGGPLALLRSGSGGFPLPIKPEFTNWRDEQESWRTTAALMDLSHHMNDLEADLTYGDEVELVWGEPDGGSANPLVERHTQTTIRAVIQRRPFPAD